MNDLTIHGGNAVTMTSLEISKLVESNHADVRRSIERLSTRGVITLPPTAEVSNDGPGPKTISVYSLCKRDSLIVVAQLCPEFTARIVDRWQELEEQAAKPALNPANFSRLQLIELAMEAEQGRLQEERERKAAEAKLAIAAPKAEALDRMAIADGEVCLQTAGKLLQQPPNKFIVWLRSLGTWIFKRHGSSRNSAYTDKINAGYLAVRTVTTLRPDGSERVNDQVVVTPKGLVKLAQMLGVSIGDGPVAGVE